MFLRKYRSRPKFSLKQLGCQFFVDDFLNNNYWSCSNLLTFYDQLKIDLGSCTDRFNEGETMKVEPSMVTNFQNFLFLNSSRIRMTLSVLDSYLEPCYFDIR